MHIVNCLHPRYVLNTQTGERIRVRCGKCSACLNAKAKYWINKLVAESENHRYSFMVNLTYDNRFLPCLHFDSSGNNLVLNRPNGYVIPFSELTEYIDNLYLSPQKDESVEAYSERMRHQQEKELSYLVSRLKHKLGLPIVCPDDISKFNKRLNKYIHDHYTGKYQNFRFFLAHEYGPSTYRPHAHAVYYIDDPRVAADFEKIVLACWSFGDSSVACIYSKGGFSYVAQYVNMSCHLPSFYAHKNLKQRHQFSKCPPLGFMQVSCEELSEIYDRSVTKRTVWDATSSRYVSLPVDNTFKNRFFPKFPGYNRIPGYARAILYRSAEILPSYDFEQFIETVYQYSNADTLYSNAFTHDERFIIEFCRELHIQSKLPELVELKLRKLYNVSCRFIAIRTALNTTTEWLCSRIDRFYKQVDYEKLVDFYKYQENYCILHSARDLIHMYPDFDFYWSNIDDPESSDNVVYNLALLSFDTDIYSLDKVDYSETADFKNMVDVSEKIYKDTHKRQDINNYRYSQKFHNLDPELQKIILDYA